MSKTFVPIACAKCGNTHRLSFGEKWIVLYAYEQWTDDGGKPGITEEPKKYEEARYDNNVQVFCPKCGFCQEVQDTSIKKIREIAKRGCSPIHLGQRHQAVTRMGKAFVANGITENLTVLLSAYNDANCNPPLPFTEILEIVAKINEGDRS